MAQRISVRYRLKPFTLKETMNYVRHRLTIATKDDRVHLNAGILMLIHLISGGVPRRINQLCDRSLLAAYAKGGQVVSPWMVRKAAREIV